MFEPTLEEHLESRVVVLRRFGPLAERCQPIEKGQLPARQELAEIRRGVDQ